MTSVLFHKPQHDLTRFHALRDDVGDAVGIEIAGFVNVRGGK
jgi:hypothetical protein